MQKQQAGDLAGAVTEYQQFLKLHPEATAIHSNLGAALAGLGRFAEALPEYKIALKQSPKLVGARLNLALVYYKMGQIDNATTELEKIHTEDPGNHQAVLLLGDCYLRMGREEDVIRVLQPAQQKYPDEQAAKYFARALETRPGDPGVRYQQALVSIDEGHLDEARQTLEGLVKQSPQFTEAHVSLSLVYYRLKRPEDSKRERELVLKLTAAAQAKQPGAKLK